MYLVKGRALFLAVFMIALITLATYSKQPSEKNQKLENPQLEVKLLIEPKEINIEVGKKQQFTLGLENGNLNDLSDIKWSVHGNVGIIAQNGLFTASNKSGRGAIVATAKLDNKNLIASAQTNVAKDKIPLGPSKKINVSISPSSASLSPNSIKSFSVISPPNNAKIQWNVIPSQLGTIDNNGNFAASNIIGKGMVIATVSTKDSVGTGKSDIIIASTTEQAQKLKISLDINPEYVKLKKGKSTRLQAIINELGEDDKYTLEWKVEPDLGVIAASDKAKDQVIFKAGNNEGKAIITATLKTDYVTYTDWAIVEIVRDQKPILSKYSVEIDPNNANLKIGEKQIFTANIIGNLPNSQINWSWSVTPKKLGYLTIIDNQNVSFEALESGWGMLVAKADDGRSIKIGQTKIYISENNKELPRYNISPQFTSIQTGGNSIKFTLVDEKDNLLIGIPISWGVIPEKMGTINENGNFISKDIQGHAIITAKIQNGKDSNTIQTRLTITEKDIHKKLSAIITGKRILSINEPANYKISVKKSNETEIDLNNAIIEWRLIPDNLGTIKGSGKIADFIPNKQGSGVIIASIKTTQGVVNASLSIKVEK